MKSCQKQFILSRMYDANNECVTYMCEKQRFIAAIDISNSNPKDVCKVDKRFLRSIMSHCKKCSQGA